MNNNQLIDKEFLDLLSCPANGKPLVDSDGQLVNREDGLHYPVINDIPWLLKNPLHSMVDWSVKLNHLNQVITDELRLLNNEIEKASGPTKNRLQNLADCKRLFLNSVSELVSPILSAKVASKPVYDALSDRAPITQNLLSYESNLYRDWVWGESENQQSVEIIKNIADSASIESMLVLGAGSGKLALDSHLAFSPKLTIANDINPLLLFAFNQLLKGKDISIPEFPAFPKDTQSIAIKHTINRIKNPPSNLHLLFSDATRPAIRSGAVDTLVTPWLIDIQPLALGQFVAALNQYLPIGGQWINFGSLVFNQKKQSLCYPIEEVKSIVESQGFKLEKQSNEALAYLKSPYNAGFRTETVWSWRATKIKDVAYTSTYQSLPDWILEIDKPIPLTKEIQSFVFSHQMFAELAGRVNGKRSIADIAAKISRDKKIDEKESLSMVKNFFLKIAKDQI